MRIVLIVCGVVFLLLLSTITLGFLHYSSTKGALETQSKKYIDDLAPRILTNWDVDLTMQEASPEFIQKSNREAIQDMFQVISKQLGTLTEYKVSVGNVQVQYLLPFGRKVIGTYEAEVQFQKAPGKVRFRTILHEGKWKLLQLHVESDALKLK